MKITGVNRSLGQEGEGGKSGMPSPQTHSHAVVKLSEQWSAIFDVGVVTSTTSIQCICFAMSQRCDDQKFCVNSQRYI